jgi:hypothetical protein
MHVTIDLDELTERLRRFGEDLAFDHDALGVAVAARVDAARPRRTRTWLAVAAAVIVILAAVALIPESRDAVARWFGLEGVTVTVDPEISGTAPSVSFDLPGPGQSRIVAVDGRQVLVSTIDGTLTPTMINRSVGSSAQVREVDVDGALGLWIEGASHEIGFESPPGHIVFERMAGNTLLWQRGGVITRVEGFDDLDTALAFAREAESGT